MMRYLTAGGGLGPVRLHLWVSLAHATRARAGSPTRCGTGRHHVLPPGSKYFLGLGGTSRELVHQCARVQHAPMLDHLAVFDAELVGNPDVDGPA